ncbi:MAG: serine/threonine-protein kinase [Gemmatimonadales bacterium]
MPAPQLIGRPIGNTPAELLTSRGGRRALPDDILKAASRRLGVMSLMGAVLWLLGAGLYHFALWFQSGGDPQYLLPTASDAITGASVLLSLALFAYSRQPGRDPRFVLDLGLVYLVLTALALGLGWHWLPMPVVHSVGPTITWVGPVILMFAAIVPSTPGKVGVAGFIAASMNPVGMLVARARGTWDFGPASNVLLMHYPDYLMAGAAVVVAHVVTRLGMEVSRARELGSYQVGELLGRGGMGDVYRATHRMLARPAAIKLIRPEVAGGPQDGAELAVRRFRREAEVAASLRSPHTVELYDFGVTEDNTFYFVMELLDGMDLESLVREQGPVPAARVIHILRQVCESLAEAHARDLVHRDIKPANIHIGRLGLTADFVKVLDFGLVKSVAGASTEHSLATAAGYTPGTPAYMAPEMALGEAVDGRADLYALGGVGYFLLTGHRVFEAANGLQMIAKHLREVPVPPSQRTELPVPPGLERLVLACLAKDPAHRPRSALELSASLAAIDAQPWSGEQAAQWWRVHRPN